MSSTADRPSDPEEQLPPGLCSGGVVPGTTGGPAGEAAIEAARGEPAREVIRGGPDVAARGGLDGEIHGGAGAESALAGIGREYSSAVDDLADEWRAEARTAGRQFRLIHRMWELQRAAEAGRRTLEAVLRGRRSRPAPAGPEDALWDVADEIGPLLRLPTGTAVARVERAVLLGESLPQVQAALEGGTIGVRQAEVIVDAWKDLAGGPLHPAPEPAPPVAAVRRLAEELLAKAPEATAAQLRALAWRRRQGLLAGAEEARHRAALAQRRVWVEAREDGMAQLCALLDAGTAHAAADRLTAIGARLREEQRPSGPAGSREPGPRALWTSSEVAAAQEPCDADPDRRTVAQVRADVLAGLLLEGEPPDCPEHLRGIRGQVTVTVPALALLAHATGADAEWPAGLSGTGACAELAGYGPIPTSLAARIAAGAPSWARVLTDPVTGVVLEHDRATYTVPADLKRRLRWRDGTCRFPGCRRAAQRCDLDHTVAWAEGGVTAAGNLAHLCRHHHLLKHRQGPLGAWTVTHRSHGPAGEPCPEGVLEWRSPAGQVHVTYPREYHHPVLTGLRLPDVLGTDPPGPPPGDAAPPAGPPRRADRPSWRDPGPFSPDDPPPF